MPLLTVILSAAKNLHAAGPLYGAGMAAAARGASQSAPNSSPMPISERERVALGAGSAPMGGEA